MVNHEEKIYIYQVEKKNVMDHYRLIIKKKNYFDQSENSNEKLM